MNKFLVAVGVLALLALAMYATAYGFAWWFFSSIHAL